MTVTGEALRCNILGVDPHLLWSAKYLGGGCPRQTGAAPPLVSKTCAAQPLHWGTAKTKDTRTAAIRIWPFFRSTSGAAGKALP
jgi:acetylornithine/succinyldiaminopimelate/putrescine aminotransferase